MNKQKIGGQSRDMRISLIHFWLILFVSWSSQFRAYCWSSSSWSLLIYFFSSPQTQHCWLDSANYQTQHHLWVCASQQSLKCGVYGVLRFGLEDHCIPTRTTQRWRKMYTMFEALRIGLRIPVLEVSVYLNKYLRRLKSSRIFCVLCGVLIMYY